jgi:hypothetical protein
MTAAYPGTPVGERDNQPVFPREELSDAIITSGCVLPLSLRGYAGAMR